MHYPQLTRLLSPLQRLLPLLLYVLVLSPLPSHTYSLLLDCSLQSMVFSSPCLTPTLFSLLLDDACSDSSGTPVFNQVVHDPGFATV